MKISPQELLIVLAIVVLIFGPTQIPKISKMMGKSIQKIKKGMEEEVSKALEMLDQAIYTSLRRVDISTRYSSIQTMVILLDTNIEFAEKVVQRILQCFHKLYLGDAVTVTYSLAEIKSKKK